VGEEAYGGVLRDGVNETSIWCVIPSTLNDGAIWLWYSYDLHNMHLLHHCHPPCYIFAQGAPQGCRTAKQPVVSVRLIFSAVASPTRRHLP
jgi:hypothetical protein